MKKLKKPLLAFILLVILLPLAAIAYAYNQSLPVDAANNQIVTFVIPKNASAGLIANKLHSEGLIKDPLIFKLIIKQKGLEQRIPSGSFELSPSYGAARIAEVFTDGSQDIWVTVLEGWRKEEVVESLASQNLSEFDPEEFLKLAETSEGKLFPDTYLVPKEITANSMHSLLINTFNRKVVNGLEKEIAASPRRFDDVLIMASLIEREARDYEQMRHVAGILWNRIDIGMALQVDATLQYAKGYDSVEQKWWPSPTAADKQRPSLYNTYLNPGLPPQPIANPGLSAIKAALDPLDVDDLFYLHDGAGNMYFARTLEGHNANVNKYLR